MRKAISVGVILLTACWVSRTAVAETLQASLVSVDCSSDLGGPPLRPIAYQPVSDYAIIQDGSLNTGLNIIGGEHVWNPYGDTDSGGAVRLVFQTSTEAKELNLDIWLSSYMQSSQPIGAACMSLSEDVSDLHSIHMVMPTNNDLLHFTGSIGPTGNTFNQDSTLTVDQVRLPGNQYLVTLWGPYMASGHDAGAQGVVVYEAHATYTPVPEPSTIGLLFVGLLCLLQKVWKQSLFRRSRAS